MEAAVLRGKCKKKLLVSILLLLCVLPFTLSAPTTSEGSLIGQNSSHGNLSVPCPIGDYRSDKGVCCRKCHPGERLLQDCPNSNSRTNCSQCKEGTFTDHSNAVRNCRRCRVCRDSDYEEEGAPCKRNKDRECRCVKGFYRNVINSLTQECLKCKNCMPQCEFLCGLNTPLNTLGTQKPTENVYVVLPIVLASSFILLVVIGMVTYLATKKRVKKKMRLKVDDLSSSSEKTSRDSQKSTKSLIAYSECPERQNLAAPTQECDSHLPDCVPKEIKIQQVIYSVLDLVSMRQVKQLVRSLGVNERDIERAEVDYRSVQEANYQMLKLWAEGGARGGARGGVLPHAALQELLVNLREMDLGGVAENLEEKFRVQ